jgi:ketosteroid isomerase-like protein
LANTLANSRFSAVFPAQSSEKPLRRFVHPAIVNYCRTPVRGPGGNSMTIELPHIIQSYVDSSNRHDVQSILSCFSDDAVVHDEEEALHGKKAIEDWITKTIEKYKFQYKPLSLKGDEREAIVTIEVSGTFDGSPITLDYHFAIERDKIVSLVIE